MHVDEHRGLVRCKSFVDADICLEVKIIFRVGKSCFRHISYLLQVPCPGSSSHLALTLAHGRQALGSRAPPGLIDGIVQGFA